MGILPCKNRTSQQNLKNTWNDPTGSENMQKFTLFSLENEFFLGTKVKNGEKC
jgi:hypothetical protein